MEKESTQDYKKIKRVQRFVIYVFMFSVLFTMINTVLLLFVINYTIHGELIEINKLFVLLEIINCGIMFVSFIIYLYYEHKSINQYDNEITSISNSELNSLLNTIKEQNEKIRKQWQLIDKIHNDSFMNNKHK